MRHLDPMALGVGLLVVGAMVAGCRGESRPDLKLRDTEGRSFSARCEPKRGCRVQQTGGPRDPGGFGELVVRHQSMLTVVCGVAVGATAPADVRHCRALECQSDRECPPELGGPRYGHCVSGLCIDPAGELTPDDVVLLCLAGKGLGQESPAQIEAHAMGVNCGSPCRIPKPCRQF